MSTTVPESYCFEETGSRGDTNFSVLDEKSGAGAVNAETTDPNSSSEDALLDYTIMLDQVRSSRELLPGQTRVLRPARRRKRRPVNP
jgi:hypothetical protein